MERLFNLDAQLLFDACVMALSMLVMFTFLSYLLFKPVRKLLEDRKQRVADEQESAKNDRKEAAVYKEEYEQKLKEIARVVKKDGFVISFGWNSGGIGKKLGFEQKEIMLVSHGGNHNDTIVTVEFKIKAIQ